MPLKTSSAAVRCRSILSALWILQNVVAVLATAIPTFSLEPQPTTVLVGSDVVLHCVAEGVPDPVITWKRYLDPDVRVTLQTDSKYEVFTNGTLLIRDVAFSDEMFYSCSAQNDEGTGVKTVSLTVVETVENFFFTLTPSNKTVTEDESVTWQCTTNMPSQISWSKIDGDLPSDRLNEVFNGVIEINPVLPEDQGLYSCTGAAGQQTASHIFSLDVKFAPRIIQHPGTVMEIRERENLVMDCVIQGNPVPEIQWILPSRETLTVPSRLGDTQVFENGTLLVKGITESMAGWFACAAANELNSVQANTFVYVMFKPRLVWQPTSTEALVGSTVKLECEALGYPQHTTTWYRTGTNVSIQLDETYTESPEGALIIKDFQATNEGSYTCLVENVMGRIEASANVRLIELPTVDIGAPSVVTAVGQDVMINCTVTGIPQPEMKWLRRNNQLLILEDNMNLFANMSLYIRGIRPGQFGSYTCRAQNRLGFDSARLQIQTVDIPVFTVRPVDTSALEGTTVNIRCKGQGEDEPVTSWFSIDDQGQRAALTASDEGFEITPNGLTITNVQRWQEGTYECAISNNVGEATATVRLDVEYAPVIEQKQAEVSVVAGQQFRLQCPSEADPTAEVTWQPPRDQPIIRQDPGGRRVNGYSVVTDTLIVQSADVLTHFGEWSCIVCNRHACETGTRTVFVQGTPVLTGVDVEWVSEREVVVISAEVIGFPRPDISFFTGQQLIDPNNPPEGHRVTDEETLEIVGGYSGSSYTIDARNYYGSDRTTINVPGKVFGVTLAQITNTSVILSWNDNTVQTVVPTRHFTVHITEVDTGSKAEINIEESPLVVRNLSPYTNYSFVVMNENALGSSPPSDIIYGKTPEGVPGTPRDLGSKWEDNTLILSWKHAEKLFGNPDDIMYEVQYRAYTPDPTTMTLMHFGTPLVKYMEGLSSAFGIMVTLTAVNTAVDLRSEPVTLSVPVRTADDLPVPIILSAAHINNTAIHINWQLPTSDHIVYDSILIRLSETANRAGVVTNAIIDDQFARNHTLGQLNPFIGYTVELATLNTKGFSNFSQPFSVPAYSDPPLQPLLTGDDGDDGLSVGAIIGIIAGILGFIFLVLLICLLCVLCCRSRKHEQKERIIDSIYADNRSLQYSNYGYRGPDSDLLGRRANIKGQYDVQVAAKQHYIKAKQQRKVYTISREQVDPPVVYSVPNERPVLEGNLRSVPQVASMQNGSEFGFYKVKVSPPKYDEMYKLPAEAYIHLVDTDSDTHIYTSPENPPVAVRPVYSTPNRPVYSRVNKKRKKTATPSPVLRSAMRSTPSPKIYRSLASQSPSNNSRVRFEENVAAIDNPLFQPGNHFRPIRKQQSSPVHLHAVVSAPPMVVVKPEPIHYTGLSERPAGNGVLERSSYGSGTLPGKQRGKILGSRVNGDTSADEGYGDSGNESGFILGTFPRSHREKRKYQQQKNQGSLFAKTVPWKKA